MQGPNRPSMSTSNLPTAVVVDEPLVRRESTGIELDPNDPNPQRETVEYQQRLKPGVNIRIGNVTGKIHTVFPMLEGAIEVHFNRNSDNSSYLVTGVGIIPRSDLPLHRRLSDIEIID